jgi:FixJ family two-component response regulator
LRGKSYVTPKLKPENWAVREARAHQYSKELTPRQRDVLQLLAEGRPMKEVGGILNVSEKTVNVPQVPHHEDVQPQKQRRSCVTRAPAGADLGATNL